MTEIIPDGVGLFGWVPAAPRGQGRPAFEWTREKSNRCMVLFAAGHGQKEVAGVLGCDVKTLRKVYSRECRVQAKAALVVRAGMMAALVDEGEKGNVGAIKALDKMIEGERVKVTSQKVKKRGAETAPARAPVLGKKEQAKLDAANMGGLYAARPAPSGLVN